MKFTKIRLVGPSNVDLPKEGVVEALNPFVLKGADGIGPVEVDVAYAKTLQMGGVYQGRRPQLREITVLVGLQPDWNIGQTAEELRTILYGLLTPKFELPIKVQFMEGETVVAEARGQVKTMEISAFSKDPEVQIVVSCDHAYLMAPTIVYQTPSKTVSGGQTLIDVTNSGTAPSGFWMGITFTAPHTASLQILDNASFPKIMNLGTGFATGDTVIVDTRAGTRGAWKIAAAGGGLVSILSELSPTSAWIQLHGGTNRLKINNTTGFNWFGSKFGHTPAYWGV